MFWFTFSFYFFFFIICFFFLLLCALVNDNTQEVPLASLKDKTEKWKPLGEIHADPFITPAKMPVWNFSTFETFPMEVEPFHLLSWQQLHMVLSLNNSIFVFKSPCKLSVTPNGEKNYSKKYGAS